MLKPCRFRLRMGRHIFLGAAISKIFAIIVHSFRAYVVSFAAMTYLHHRSLSLTQAIVTITLVAACWALTEERCEAGCGDYLVHHNSSQLHGANGLFGKADSPIDRPVPACPCQGPGCSRRSETPAAPAPIPPEMPTEWAFLIEQIRDRDATSQSWSLESELLLFRHSGQRLDRPPRACA